jgi:hypothetical protein
MSTIGVWRGVSKGVEDGHRPPWRQGTQWTRSALYGRKIWFNQVHASIKIWFTDFISPVSVVTGILELLGASHYFQSNVHSKAYFDMQIRLSLF